MAYGAAPINIVTEKGTSTASHWPVLAAKDHSKAVAVNVAVISAQHHATHFEALSKFVAEIVMTHSIPVTYALTPQPAP